MKQGSTQIRQEENNRHRKVVEDGKGELESVRKMSVALG